MVDSKCDYPAACNAMETLLIHKDLLRSAFLDRLLKALREKGVSLNIYHVLLMVRLKVQVNQNLALS